MTTKRLILFLGWCLFVLILASCTTYYAWSPFADGKRDPRNSFYGPTHK
jgi:hypothetical protein